MIDKELNTFLKPILRRIALIFIDYGFKSNQVTLFGLIIGLLSFIFLINKFFHLALIFFLFNRFLDGIDGAIARETKISDLGGFYDIVSDYIIYSIIPLGFILIYEQNSFYFAFLLSSFVASCSSFLASAWIIEKTKKIKISQKNKSFFYIGGITEGFETIIFFSSMIVFHEFAHLIALIFGILCWLTFVIRVIYIRNLYLKE